ncbi:hypothetical protein ACFFHF_16650 [Robertmurraya beringensis]|uniref:Uncharacterized protein n=1 Tax=Robertmurraya beringensis TaxID=641660 RepID=A0ABV6KU84_9BACI
MELTKEEKYKIYEEEKERLRQIEEEAERKRLDSLSPEEKKKIFAELESRNTLVVNGNNLIYHKSKVLFIISIAITIIVFFINIYAGIGVLIATIYLEFFKKNDGILKLKYNCPKCNHLHSNVLRNEEIAEQRKNGFIKAKCLSCSHVFQLNVEEDVLKKFE